MTNINELEKKWRKNLDFVEAYEALADEFELAGAVIKSRIKAGSSQAELAKRMHTGQPTVARIESGEHNN